MITFCKEHNINAEDLIPKEWKDPKYFESLVRENQNSDGGVDWERIASFYILSEDFIREFQDKWDEFCWLSLSTEQNLSEKFIKEFTDKIDWGAISAHQKLSVVFVIKHVKEVNWNNIYRYQNYDDETKKMLEEISHHKILPREIKMWKRENGLEELT